MKSNLIETILGFSVIFIVICCSIFFCIVNNVFTNDKYYNIYAKFQNIEGIVKGSNISISGIKVGEVKNISLDSKNLIAVVKLKIKCNIKLPVDSQALIMTNGFLGNKFISLNPGISDKFLENNDEIFYTQSSINMETIIGKLLYFNN